MRLMHGLRVISLLARNAGLSAMVITTSPIGDLAGLPGQLAALPGVLPLRDAFAVVGQLPARGKQRLDAFPVDVHVTMLRPARDGVLTFRCHCAVTASL